MKSVSIHCATCNNVCRKQNPNGDKMTPHSFHAGATFQSGPRKMERVFFFFPSLNSRWLKKRCYKGAECFKRSSVRSTLCSSNEMWSRSRYVGVASPRIYNSPMYKNQAEIQQRARLTSQRQLTCVVSDANDGKHRKNILGDPTKFHKVISQSFSHPYFAKYTQLFVRVMQPYSKQTML